MIDELEKAKELFAAGKLNEAKFLLLSLIQLNPDHVEAQNNLGVIAYQQGDVDTALEFLEKALTIDSTYKDALLNITDIASKLNKPMRAIPYVEQYKNKYPDDEEIRRLLTKLHSLVNVDNYPGKIAVVCLPGLESFLHEIVKFLKGKVDVRICYSKDLGEISSAVSWADAVWIEWANELAISLTNHETILNGKRVICRLHSYEALSGYANRIKWERINDLIFVAEHIKQILLKQVPDLEKKVDRIHIVPNGVNLERFPFKKRNYGKKLVFLGSINYKKGPMLLFHAFHELVKRDNSYQLYIGGDVQDYRYLLYFEQLSKELGIAGNIKFEGRIHNVLSWLNDKHMIICSSVLESQGMGLMEAMACGLKPLIHNFVGAREVYPSQYIWNTIPEFVKLVCDKSYNSQEYREVIEKQFSLKKQLDHIDRIFTVKR